MNKVKISSLDDLKKTLDRINSGDEVLISDLDFSNLSKINFKIYGHTYNGKLNSNIVVALNNYHNELQKIYCMVKYNSNNLRNLSQEDKKYLLVEYEIQEGCTDIINALTSFVDAMGNAFNKMTNGMSGNQKTACMISLMFFLTIGWASSEYTSYLNNVNANQANIDLGKQEIEKIKAIQDGIISATQGNSRSESINSNIETQVKQTYSSTLKLLPSVDKVEVSSGDLNINLDKNEIANIISTEKSKLETIESVKTLNIESVKKSLDRLTITCSEVGSDYSFTLSVDRSFIDIDEESIIFDNFKIDKSIVVFGAFKVRDGIIEKANASTIKSVD